MMEKVLCVFKFDLVGKGIREWIKKTALILKISWQDVFMCQSIPLNTHKGTQGYKKTFVPFRNESRGRTEYPLHSPEMLEAMEDLFVRHSAKPPGAFIILKFCNRFCCIHQSLPPHIHKHTCVAFPTILSNFFLQKMQPVGFFVFLFKRLVSSPPLPTFLQGFYLYIYL